MRAVALVSIVCIATLSGCLSSDEGSVAPPGGNGQLAVDQVLTLLSPPLGDVAVLHEELAVETAAGTLRADVYRGDPATLPSDWRSPVIVIASPYNNGAKDRTDGNRLHSDLYDWLENFLVPRGYAVVHLDTLGTRDSSGCTTVMDSTERRATAEAIDVLGEMEWSSGRVGMIGKSYVGATQVGAAIEAPEHLVTIVPVSPVTNAYAYHYRNGVPYLGNQATNVLYATNTNLLQGTLYDGPTDAGDPTAPLEQPDEYAEGAVCFPESVAQGANPLGDYTERWADRDMRTGITTQPEDISVLFIHGHQDWNVKPDHFSDVWNSYPSQTKLAMLGQWHHDYPDNNRWNPDAHGHREDWYWLLHRWFDNFLLDIDTGLEAEIEVCPVQTQASDAIWRCMNGFPEADDTLTLFPAGDALGTTPGTASAMYAEPGSAPTHAGRDVDPPMELRFGYVFENATRVVGIPNITLDVSTTSPYNSHLIAALSVTTGGATDELTWAIQSLRHRNGLQGEPVVPATNYQVVFDFFMLDHVFAAGDRLELILRGTSLEPNLGVTPNPVPGVVSLNEAGSSLRLPVSDADWVFTPLSRNDVPAEYNPQLA